MMFTDLPGSFPNSLAVSPPISVLPPLSSSSLSPKRHHPPPVPLLMALLNQTSSKKCLIMPAVWICYHSVYDFICKIKCDLCEMKETLIQVKNSMFQQLILKFPSCLNSNKSWIEIFWETPQKSHRAAESENSPKFSISYPFVLRNRKYISTVQWLRPSERKGHNCNFLAVIHTFSDPGAGQLVTCDITLLQAMPWHKPEPTWWKLKRRSKQDKPCERSLRQLLTNGMF